MKPLDSGGLSSYSVKNRISKLEDDVKELKKLTEKQNLEIIKKLDQILQGHCDLGEMIEFYGR